MALNRIRTRVDRSQERPGVAIRVGATIRFMFVTAFKNVSDAVGYLSQHLHDYLLDRKHAVYGLAVARIALGLTVVGGALTNFSTRDYVFGGGGAWSGELPYPTSDFIVMWPFDAIARLYADSAMLTIVMIVHMLLGLLFLVGYRTRLVMVPLFLSWVTMHDVNLLVHDQSDNLVRMALIALMFASPAERWSLDAWRRRRNAGREAGILLTWWRNLPVFPEWVTNISHNCGVVVLGAQLCMVYASGGLFKAQGRPWYEGWAVHDPILTRQFGNWPELSELVTAWAPMVALGTVLTVLVQVSFPLLLLRRGTRIFGLIVILGFHLAIGVLMGLPWFSASMLALDCIFISDRSWQSVFNTARHSWHRSAIISARQPGRGVLQREAVSSEVAAEGKAPALLNRSWSIEWHGDSQMKSKRCVR